MRAFLYLFTNRARLRNTVSNGETGSEKHLNPSMKIIKAIRMDQLESKAAIDSVEDAAKVGRQ